MRKEKILTVTTNTTAMNDKDEITNNLSESLVHPRSSRYREKEKKYMYVNVYVMMKKTRQRRKTLKAYTFRPRSR
jgi:hypothetical protein